MPWGRMRMCLHVGHVSVPLQAFRNDACACVLVRAEHAFRMGVPSEHGYALRFMTTYSHAVLGHHMGTACRAYVPHKHAVEAYSKKQTIVAHKCVRYRGHAQLKKTCRLAHDFRLPRHHAGVPQAFDDVEETLQPRMGVHVAGMSDRHLCRP